MCDRIDQSQLALQNFLLLLHTFALTPALSSCVNLFSTIDSAIFAADTTVKVPLAIDSTSSPGSYI